MFRVFFFFFEKKNYYYNIYIYIYISIVFVDLYLSYPNVFFFNGNYPNVDLMFLVINATSCYSILLLPLSIVFIRIFRV